MSEAAESTGAVEIRVVSYNIRSMRDDVGALTAVIRELAPDILCIQEAPRFGRWRSKCAGLARSVGMVVLTGGRSAGAMLLLGSMRTRLRYAENLKLPKMPGLHQRGLAIADVEVLGPGGAKARLVAGSMHLSLDAKERLAQASMLVGHFNRVRARTGTPSGVLAGDVNEEPGQPSWAAFADSLRDAYVVAPWGGELTIPSRGPDRRIDGVFVSDDVEVVRAGVPDLPMLSRASDHMPVVADIRVPAV